MVDTVSVIEKPVTRLAPEEELLNAAKAVLVWLETATIEDFAQVKDMPMQLALQTAIHRYETKKELEEV